MDSPLGMSHPSLQASAEDFLFTDETSSVVANDGVNKANSSFRMGAGVGLMIWLVCVSAIITFSPLSSYEEPQGVEREIHVLSILFMVMTNGSRLLNMVLREKSRTILQSGVIFASLVVQGVAIWANAWMAFFPTPVLEDPISGQRFYLIRWAEWVSLTFLMSFLTYNIDSVEGPSFRGPFIMTLSTGSAFVFPHCQTKTAWYSTLVVSFLLFSSLYVVLFQKAAKYAAVKASVTNSKRPSAVAQELYQIARYGYVLALTCAVTWTTLAATFVLVCLGPELIPLSHHLPRSTLLVIHSCVNEVSAKYYYFSVLTDAYEMVFESNARLSRRLEESRGFMSAVWESSSDVIVFGSKKSKDRVSAYVSLAFLKLMNFSEDWADENPGDWDSLFLDINPQKGKFNVYMLDTSVISERQDAIRIFNVNEGGKLVLEGADDTELPRGHAMSDGKDSTPRKNLTALARLVVRAFDGQTTDKQVSFSDSNQSPKVCEATISRLKEDKIVIVLRDITDRVERFEAEKTLVKERANRLKDEQINHFTRHEVKNGILTAMGIVEQLRERIDNTYKNPARDINSNMDHSSTFARDINALMHESTISDTGFHDSVSEKNEDGTLSKSNMSAPFDTSKGLDELDGALSEVLDTILDEAMAREIIHDEYVPTVGGIQVKEVLSSLRRGVSAKFQLRFDPEPFPELFLDRQLLRYIYRKAFSNACRYGRPGGAVHTKVSLDMETKKFILTITNKPGPSQKALMELGEEGIEGLFAHGTRLPVDDHEERDKSTPSSASGTWVMRKCAEAAGGTCNLRFEENKTCFWFSCPARVVEKKEDKVEHEPEFALPSNVWVIILEDSAPQRKLLDRCFAIADVPQARRVSLGQNAEEIHGFIDHVASLIANNPDDKFLMIIDENLEVFSDGGAHTETVSGSGTVRKLRDVLTAEAEERTLALIRSANDSAKEVEHYLQCAHGFLRKEPVRKGKILSYIEPFWKKRFPKDLKIVERTPSTHEELCPSSEDIQKVLHEINTLSEGDEVSARWMTIRDRLHSLKGDLMTMRSDDFTCRILVSMDRLREPDKAPKDFDLRWKGIQDKIEKLL